MGCYDTFGSRDESVQVQLKAGPSLMDYYVEGGSQVVTGYPDGLYLGWEGAVLIQDGTLVSVTKDWPKNVPETLPRFTKWGESFDGTEDQTPFSVFLNASLDVIRTECAAAQARGEMSVAVRLQTRLHLLEEGTLPPGPTKEPDPFVFARGTKDAKLFKEVIASLKPSTAPKQDLSQEKLVTLLREIQTECRVQEAGFAGRIMSKIVSLLGET